MKKQTNKNWDYKGYYKNYDMTGEITVGTGIVKVHDIFNPLPEFMKIADCVFCDPPCSLSNLNSFYTKADRKDYQDSYLPFAERFWKCIDEIVPDRLFVEVFKSNKDYFLSEISKRYKHIVVYDSMYYHNSKNKCWIIQGTQVAERYPFGGKDESDIISDICKQVPFYCIGDLCIGQGLVGKAAFANNRRFVGTEINKKRLAVLVHDICKSV